jgi:hypothetical protein
MGKTKKRLQTILLTPAQKQHSWPSFPDAALLTLSSPRDTCLSVMSQVLQHYIMLLPFLLHASVPLPMVERWCVTQLPTYPTCEVIKQIDAIEFDKEEREGRVY